MAGGRGSSAVNSEHIFRAEMCHPSIGSVAG